MAKKYKTYIDKDEKEYVFKVLVIHGHSDEWKEVESFIKKELIFDVQVLKTEFLGNTILKKFKDSIWHNCACAVAIMSPDDKGSAGELRARQNVIYEIGYCQGFFDLYYWSYDEDFEPVIILREKTVEINSDLQGLEFLEYDQGNIKATFKVLKKTLAKIYDSINNVETD